MLHCLQLPHQGAQPLQQRSCSDVQQPTQVLDVVWDPQVQEYMTAAMGAEVFAAMQAALTVPPLHTCVRVNTLRTTPEEVMRQLHELVAAATNSSSTTGTAAASSTTATAHSTASVSNDANTNTAAAPSTTTPAANSACSGNSSSANTGCTNGSSRFSRFSISSHPKVPVAVRLQGSGPHHVNLSTVTKQVLISRKAGEAVLRGAHVFIPGVLGCSASVSAGDTVAVMIDLKYGQGSASTRGMVLPALHSAAEATYIATEAQQQQQQPDTPEQLQQKGQQQSQLQGLHEAQPQQQQQQQQQWLCAGIGKASVGRAELFRLQHGVAVELTQRVYDVPSLNGQLQGSVMLQNFPSIVTAHVLNPPPGSRVLDMCASPGGKTTMLAQIMGCVGEVYALDRTHAKVDDIRSLAEELGVSSCITAIKMDATKAAADAAGAVTCADDVTSSPQSGSTTVLEQEQEELVKMAMQQQEGKHQDRADRSNGVQSMHEQQQEHQQLHDDLQRQQQGQQQQEPNDSLQRHAAFQHPQSAQDSSRQPEQPRQHRRRQRQQQQQQQQQAPGSPSLGSMSAQARLSRRLASMAARGHTPAPKEFRRHSSAPAAPRFPGFAPESFTHVLLDAPCTALGLRPKLQQPLTLPQLLEAAAYQRQLLAAAVRLVRPGGYLVFSTCSVSPAENEVNVRHVLDTYPCMQLVPAEPLVGGPGLKGPAVAAQFAEVLAQAASQDAGNPNASVMLAAQEAAAVLEAVSTGQHMDGWLSEEQARMVQRFCPESDLDTIGFFMAKFQKVCSCVEAGQQ